MRRISLLTAIAGLALLLASVLPWTDSWRETASATPAADIAYGKALFQAKGCASCHAHSSIAGARTYFGGPAGTPPDLTSYIADATSLRAWLRDPQAVKPTTGMPNLKLSEAEITALIAFLKSAPVPVR